MGKEYNDEGELIFEGEYFDGKKYNGYGKEYDEDTGKLIFECNYLDGKRNGLGQEYVYIPCDKRENEYLFFSDSYNKNSKRITIFSGEYLNGERINGKNIIMMKN